MNEVSLRERVKEPPSAALVDSYYRPGLERARPTVFPQEMWAHLAHALMLDQQGILKPEVIPPILRCVLGLAEAGVDSVPVDYRQEDLYSYVEKRIVAELGPDIGGRLHTGRSRNDLNATTWRMALRERVLTALEGLSALRARLLDMAEQHSTTVMPGYTHWQHAQPVTFGYWLLAAADVLARDHKRLFASLAHTNLCPLGAGALTTTAFPLNRAMVADLLGFDAPMEVAYDAVSSHDDGLEALSAMSVLMTFLSRLATDLIAWSTWEYGFVEPADRHSAVSSIMPQKKNPAALEHLRASTGMVTGALTAALACTKNTPFADVNDAVTAVNEPMLDAALRTGRALVLMEEVFAGLSLRAERMAEAARLGFGSATELADVIVREAGLSFRMAHNVVAGVVSDALERGISADRITSADIDRSASAHFGHGLGIPDAAVRQAMDPAENIRTRTVQGGPAPGNMATMIAGRRAALATDRDAVRAVATRIDQARTRCVSRARDRAEVTQKTS